MKVLMVDNYDSFTYNLVQYLGELGAEVTTLRNDALDAGDVERLAPAALIVSPGPCTPHEAGVSMALIETFAERLPILGVCLGHQCIGQVFGARIGHAARVMHGKTSPVEHDGRGVFQGLPDGYRCTRYHSLVIEPDTVPGCLEVSAWSGGEAGDRREIMGVRHRSLPIEGVQFHPESILTEHGHDLLRNFLDLARAAAAGPPRA